MHASFRQRPPTLPFSTTAVFIPTCAARIAPTYPPGPEPITLQSYLLSGMAMEPTRCRMASVLLSRSHRHLDSRHRLDEEPEQGPAYGDDREGDQRVRDVAYAEQRERGCQDRQREQRLHPEHGVVAAA